MSTELPLPAELAQALPQLLEHLLDEDCLSGVCVEETEGSGWRLAAAGLSGFLPEPTIEGYLARPIPWLALTLLDRARLASVIDTFLPHHAIATANAEGGLHLFPFLWLQRPFDPASAHGRELMSLGQQTFIRFHRGYRLKSVIKEVPAAIEQVFTGGGFIRRSLIPAGSPMTFPGMSSNHDRVILGLTREECERDLPGPAVGWLFGNSSPRCGFTRVEQQVLQCAVDGLTDHEIAGVLCVTANTVRDRWRSIFERVHRAAPHVLPSPNPERGGRGPEKRRPVLLFIDDHPEELRPYVA